MLGNYVEDPGCNVVVLAIVIINNNLVNYNIIILRTGLELDNDWDCLHCIDYVQSPVMIYCNNAMVPCHINTRDMYCLCHRLSVKAKWLHIHPLNPK